MSNKKSSSSKMAEEDAIAAIETSKDFINFFLKELRNVFWIEKHLDKLFKKMQKAAISGSLKDSLASHLDNSELHLDRLKQIFDVLGEVPREKKSEAIAVLAEEAKALLQGTGKKNNMRDAGILSSAQKMLHHKIAAYGTLVKLAETMGHEDVIGLLKQTLAEEKQAVDLLNNIAENDMESKPQTNKDNELLKAAGQEATAVYDSINLTGKQTQE